MSRRNFIKTTGTGVAAAAIATGLPGTLAPAVAQGSNTIPTEQISIQLYTLRDLMSVDLVGTLGSLAAIGYQRVEHAGFHGRTVDEFKAILDDVGLWANSGHQGIPQPFDANAWDASLEDASVLGSTDIVHAFGPFGNSSLDDWRRFAEDLNVAGEQARAAGLRLGYHNHHFESLPLDDGATTGWDVLFGDTDKRFVHFEVDIFWSFRGGRDPVDLLAENRNRITQFHVKDLSGDFGSNFANPGRGVIQFDRVFAAGRDVADYIVERDDAGDGALVTAQDGYDLLSTITF